MTTTSKSSGVLGVQSAALNVGRTILTGVSVTAAAADVVVIIYDSLTAANKIAFQHTTDLSLVGLSQYIELPNVRCEVGAFVVVTGTGAEVIVHYK